MNRAFIKSISFFALLAFAGFFTACQEEDSIMTTENFVLQSTKGIEDQCGAGRAGCYELVFPITLQFADSTTAVVNNYAEMKLAIRTWFEANGNANGNLGIIGIMCRGINNIDSEWRWYVCMEQQCRECHDQSSHGNASHDDDLHSDGHLSQWMCSHSHSASERLYQTSSNQRSNSSQYIV